MFMVFQMAHRIPKLPHASFVCTVPEKVLGLEHVFLSPFNSKMVMFSRRTSPRNTQASQLVLWIQYRTPRHFTLVARLVVNANPKRAIQQDRPQAMPQLGKGTHAWLNVECDGLRFRVWGESC